MYDSGVFVRAAMAILTACGGGGGSVVSEPSSGKAKSPPPCTSPAASPRLIIKARCGQVVSRDNQVTMPATAAKGEVSSITRR